MIFLTLTVISVTDVFLFHKDSTSFWGVGDHTYFPTFVGGGGFQFVILKKKLLSTIKLVYFSSLSFFFVLGVNKAGV